MNWILKTAQAAGVDSDSYSQWLCVKQLQMVYHGHQSMRTLAVLDENSHLFFDLDATTAHWCRHFTKVLNITSKFSLLGIDGLK